MSDTTATNQFLSWVRSGLATVIATGDTFHEEMESRVAVSLTVEVNNRDEQISAPSVPVRLYGPGDVIGIDPRQVIRTYPKHQTSDFEPNYFPSIEFEQPDFPWLFSPVSADKQSRLRPWICLVTVRKQPGVTLTVDPHRPLPVLTISHPSQELPDLNEAWAWAHAQVAGDYSATNPLTVEALAEVLANTPELALSRLLSPRRLQPNLSYYACLVPTFAVGRSVGLGQQPGNDLAPAWDCAVDAPVEIPVYYYWEFSTATTGSFESLVRKLKARQLSGVGTRDMKVDEPGYGMPSAGALLGLEGALISSDASSTEWPDETGLNFQTELRALLEKSADNFSDVVVPPTYGALHAKALTQTDDDALPRWLWELNLDPRYRAAAGFGTQVIQRDQEQLMASAWNQAGNIKGVNRALRQGQLAREVGRQLLLKHFKLVSLGSLLQITQAAHASLRISSWIASSPAFGASVSPAFRRLVRRRGPIGWLVFAANENAGTIVENIQAKRLQLPSAFRRLEPPSGAVEINSVSQALYPKYQVIDYRSLFSVNVDEALGWTKPGTGQRLNPLDEWPDPPPTPRNTTQSPLPPPPATTEQWSKMLKNFRLAVNAHQKYLLSTSQLARKSALEAVREKKQVRQNLLDRLSPDVTIIRRVKARVHLSAKDTSATWARAEPLNPVTTAPKFPFAMCDALKETSTQLFAPGLEKIPPETIGLLLTNRRFIEAYMVGLNHEMSREMLWREYPVSLNSTYFQYFWKSPRQGSTGETAAPEDIPPIDTWGENNALGQNFLDSPQEASLVLLMRGGLLNRYPHAVIYAVKAAWSVDNKGKAIPPRILGETERHPVFQGRLEPDITYLGFELSVTEARGSTTAPDDPGWFFVFQEQPVEPRFGLDEATGTGGMPAQWSDLTWGNLFEEGEEDLLAQMTYVQLSCRLADKRLDNVTWGLNSAPMAFITLRSTARIAVHADTMILRDT